MTNLMEWYYALPADQIAKLHFEGIEKESTFAEGWVSVGKFS